MTFPQNTEHTDAHTFTQIASICANLESCTLKLLLFLTAQFLLLLLKNKIPLRRQQQYTLRHQRKPRGNRCTLPVTCGGDAAAVSIHNRLDNG